MRIPNWLKGRRRQQLAVRPVETGTGPASLTTHRQGWQEEAWDAYRDNVGEFSAVTNWRASAISRANLFVAELPDDADANPEPVDDEYLSSVLEKLGTGGTTGYGQLLKRVSVHLDVPGETILVGTEDKGEQRWFVASPDQVVSYGNGLAIQVDDTGSDTDYIPIPPRGATHYTGPRTVLRRIYEPDPRYPWLAISPARYARKALRILNRLTDRVNADTLSRLTNGLLLVSGEVQLPARPDLADLHNDPQMAALIHAGMAAIDNPESPAAALPIIGRANSEDISKAIHKVDLGMSFDDQIVPLFNLFVRRLSLMLNVPPEVLLGVTEANHWTAALVSDDSVRVHLTPTIELICDALTRAYLRPALTAINNQNPRHRIDPDRYVVWYDVVRITERPNRADTALAVHQASGISDEALRRAAGFSDADAPTADELRTRLLTQLALQGRKFEEIEPLLRAIGINLNTPGQTGQAAPATGVTTEGAPRGPEGNTPTAQPEGLPAPLR